MGLNLFPQTLTQFAGEAHTATLPAGNNALLLFTFSNQRGVAINFNKFQHPAGKHKYIAFLKLADKIIFNTAQFRPTQYFHQQAVVSGNGSNTHAVLHGYAPSGDFVKPLLNHHLLKIIVLLQTRAPCGDKRK